MTDKRSKLTPIAAVVRYGRKYAKPMNTRTLMDTIVSLWVAFEDAAQPDGELFIGSLLQGMVNEAKSRNVHEDYFRQAQGRAAVAAHILANTVQVTPEELAALISSSAQVQQECSECANDKCPIHSNKRTHDPKDPDVQ